VFTEDQFVVGTERRDDLNAAAGRISNRGEIIPVEHASVR